MKTILAVFASCGLSHMLLLLLLNHPLLHRIDASTDIRRKWKAITLTNLIKTTVYTANSNWQTHFVVIAASRYMPSLFQSNWVVRCFNCASIPSDYNQRVIVYCVGKNGAWFAPSTWFSLIMTTNLRLCWECFVCLQRHRRSRINVTATPSANWRGISLRSILKEDGERIGRSCRNGGNHSNCYKEINNIFQDSKQCAVHCCAYEAYADDGIRVNRLKRLHKTIAFCNDVVRILFKEGQSIWVKAHCHDFRGVST